MWHWLWICKVGGRAQRRLWVKTSRVQQNRKGSWRHSQWEPKGKWGKCYWKLEERKALLHGGGKSGSTVCGKVANEPNNPVKDTSRQRNIPWRLQHLCQESNCPDASPGQEAKTSPSRESIRRAVRITWVSSVSPHRLFPQLLQHLDVTGAITDCTNCRCNHLIATTWKTI